MLTIDLKGQLRTNLGKKESKAIRNEGLVPCVLYGAGENLNFTVDAKAFLKVLITPNVYLVQLDIDGKMHKAILKEIQFHPVTDNVLHIDFLEVTEDKPFTIKLPIKVVGHAIGVKQGGKLKIKMRKMKVSGLLKDIPNELEVDSSNLELGHSIRMSNLSFEGLTIEEAKSSVVCTVQATRDVTEAAAAAAK